MQAIPGLEPGDQGFVVLCLTTWLSRRDEDASDTRIGTGENLKYSALLLGYIACSDTRIRTGDGGL
jgi:hypothetical protein